MTAHRLIPDFPLAALAANPASVRRITAAGRTRLAAQIERHGHVGVLVARLLPDGSHRIIAGEQRLAVLRARGDQTAPCYVVKCSDGDERHLALVLNGHAGTWDEEKLDALLRELHAAGEDLGGLGIQAKTLDHLIDDLRREARPGLADPDACPAVPTVPTSRLGDVWRLGAHRLAVGDACEAATWERLLGGERIHVLATDPPYGVAYEGAAGSIANDDLDEDALRTLLTRALGQAAAHAHPGAACYVCHAESAGVPFRLACRDAGWSIRQTLVWIKDRAVLSRQDYHWRHEPILYGWRAGAAHRWCADRRQDTAWVLPGVVATADGDGHLLTITTTSGDVAVLRVPSYQVVAAGDAATTAWCLPRPARNPDHPTMKPVALVERMLANSSEPGDLVADPFAGSGTTLIACERLGRSARVIELDPRFADVAVRRWQDLTGQTAERMP